MLMSGASKSFMLPYIYLTARVEFELQSLNGAGTVGNMLKLQEAIIVVDGQQLYVPVISGNALKNWHARAMAVKYLELGGTLKSISNISKKARTGSQKG